MKELTISDEGKRYSLVINQGRVVSFTEIRNTRKCQECGDTFEPTGYQSAYCSPRCRNTHNKRNWRRRKANQ